MATRHVHKVPMMKAPHNAAIKTSTRSHWWTINPLTWMTSPSCSLARCRSARGRGLRPGAGQRMRGGYLHRGEGDGG